MRRAMFGWLLVAVAWVVFIATSDSPRWRSLLLLLVPGALVSAAAQAFNAITGSRP